VRGLLVGAGSRIGFPLYPVGLAEPDELVRLDVNPAHNPDVVWDMEKTPWPLESYSFDVVGAFEILEHLGRQGDEVSFFSHFYEIWRILKSGGVLVGTCPSYKSMWAWGDPSHKRVITSGSMTFLDQSKYSEVGVTPMSDFRHLWKGDFVAEHVKEGDDFLEFGLRAVKPARLTR